MTQMPTLAYDLPPVLGSTIGEPFAFHASSLHELFSANVFVELRLKRLPTPPRHLLRSFYGRRRNVTEGKNDGEDQVCELSEGLNRTAGN
jgi:hypothetical protein